MCRSGHNVKKGLIGVGVRALAGFGGHKAHVCGGERWPGACPHRELFMPPRRPQIELENGSELQAGSEVPPAPQAQPPTPSGMLD